MTRQYARRVDELAVAAQQWIAEGRPVYLVRVLEVRGISSRDQAGIAVVTPGRAAVGTILAGAADDQLPPLAVGDLSRLVDLAIGDGAARAAGLSCGGSARLLVQPAAELPPALWGQLAAQETVALVTPIGASSVGATTAYSPRSVGAAGPAVARVVRAGVTRTALLDGQVVTVLWPVPTLVVVGTGAIADSLVAIAGLAEWRSAVVDGADSASAAIAALGRADAVVVLSHDLEISGAALRAALLAAPGYIGALGSRSTQAARAAWLAERDVTDLSAVHGPAGLDIGANTSTEIAIAIVAEILATRSGGPGGSLRSSDGPIHRAK